MDAHDFLAVVDTNPESGSYGRIVHETPMPYVGDELRHFGWNRCSGACHGPDRSHLIIPGDDPALAARRLLARVRERCEGPVALQQLHGSTTDLLRGGVT